MQLPSSYRPLDRRAALRAGLLLLFLLALSWTGSARSEPFVDPAFTALWLRTDQPVAGHQATRTWLWGPSPGAAKREAYAEGTSGVRLVQYFDKGRMEINNPAADPKAPGYVTGGLLAVELISGRMQTGNTRFETHAPAGIPIAGDRDDATAPTYASWAAVSSLVGGEHAATSAVGNAVDQALDRDGKVSPFAAAATYNVTYAYFEPKTAHNVADVFWKFLNATGPVRVGADLITAPLFDPWYSLAGLPVSEAYWATVKIAGVRHNVLIQAFQRRVLTYTPDNPAGFQVEMGNIGLHYLEWRYTAGAGPAATLPPAPTPTSGPPPLAPVTVTGIVTGRSGLDLNQQKVTLVNNGGNVVAMGGWRLVSPKNDHVDTFNFPAGFVLPAGGTLTLFAGQGIDQPPTKLYMRRITWLFDSTGFDGVILYDGLGREVSRFFLQGGLAPTPTNTAVVEATDTPEPGPDTPTPTETTDETATPTPTAEAGTPTVTVTPGGPTATVTPTVTATQTGGPTATATKTGGATATPTLQTRPTATVTPTP